MYGVERAHVHAQSDTRRYASATTGTSTDLTAEIVRSEQEPRDSLGD